MTHGDLKLDNDVWVLTNCPPHVKIKLKKIFDSVPKYGNVFTFKNTAEVCLDLEWFHQRYPMNISTEDLFVLRKKVNDHRNFIRETEKIIRPDYKSPTEVSFKEGKKLTNYQKICVDLFWKVKRLLVADEVGLGKTVEALGALTKPENLPAIIVVQPHLVNQWAEKIEEFTHLTYKKVINSKPESLIPADIYIVKYTNIFKWAPVLETLGAKTMIMDEVQEVRRSESLKHQGCKTVAQNIENIMGLSGTPVFNYGFDLWTLYSVIKPDLLDSAEAFRREWCSSFTDKVSDPVALGSFLRDNLSYIRRTKADVKDEIPPLNKIVHTVGFDQKAIDKMENEAKILARQLLEGSFIQRGQAARELSVMVRKATGISKAKDVANYVKILLENGEKVLLAGWHRDVFDTWMEELKAYKPVLYTGSESPNQKNLNKKEFIEGDAQVLIISLRSGVGLDGLQHKCSYVVFGELDWTPAIHDQVIGRLYRNGQKEQVTAIFLVSESGSDPAVTDLLGLKKSQSDGVNDPTLIGKTKLSDDSIVKEFAKRYLKK